MATPSHMRPPRAPANWDQRFLVLASHVAGWSKDTSTKVGAIAVRDRRILATGYNGLPSGVHDSDERLNNRDLKIHLTIHAEQNCVAYAARAGVCLAGATFYVWPMMTCSHCAGILIQSDITRLVVPDYVEPLRWQESFDHARQMFIEAGVSVLRIPMRGPLDPYDEQATLPLFEQPLPCPHPTTKQAE